MAEEISIEHTLEWGSFSNSLTTLNKFLPQVPITLLGVNNEGGGGGLALKWGSTSLFQLNQGNLFSFVFFMTYFFIFFCDVVHFTLSLVSAVYHYILVPLIDSFLVYSIPSFPPLFDSIYFIHNNLQMLYINRST